MLRHRVFGYFYHTLDGKDILPVSELLVSVLQVLKHLVHVALMLVQVLQQLICHVIVPVTLFGLLAALQTEGLVLGSELLVLPEEGLLG